MNLSIPIANRERPGLASDLWNRFVAWLLEIPPNPLVWYAPPGNSVGMRGYADSSMTRSPRSRRKILVVLHDDGAAESR